MRSVVTAILFVIVFAASAQETRVLITEDSSLQTSEYDRLFNLLSSDKTQINSLFKLNAVDWGQLIPSFVYEQRIYKSFTVEPGVRVDGFGVSQQNGLKYMVTPEVRLKYYHNFRFRELRGKNTNGFSGNYFMAGIAFPFGDTPSLLESQLNRQYFYEYDLSELPVNEIQALGLLQLGYGVQRRFLDIGYFDMSFGINMQIYHDLIPKNKLLPFIKIGIGFGITPKKAKELTE
ncbi:hypothetical protein ACE1ET_19585 [Saccharicrinis sp. FJH62]|uniref:hypothetical protein n=1 Tax=Saccharicrinis sp. FJH62 TaxID=3344657 RepID=UPI0035D41405